MARRRRRPLKPRPVGKSAGAPGAQSVDQDIDLPGGGAPVVPQAGIPSTGIPMGLPGGGMSPSVDPNQEDQGYARGGMVGPGYDIDYTSPRTDPVARRRYSAKRVGFAEGGYVDDPMDYVPDQSDPSQQPWLPQPRSDEFSLIGRRDPMVDPMLGAAGEQTGYAAGGTVAGSTAPIRPTAASQLPAAFQVPAYTDPVYPTPSVANAKLYAEMDALRARTMDRVPSGGSGAIAPAQVQTDQGGGAPYPAITGTVVTPPPSPYNPNVPQSYRQGDDPWQSPFGRLFDESANSRYPLSRAFIEPRYAEGGAVDSQVATPDVEGYVRGANAMPPEQLDEILQQIAQIDPSLDEDGRNLTAIIEAAKSGHMDMASSILAGFRKRFDSLNAHAQGAAAHGDMATAAQLAGKAHSQIPDGLKITYIPGQDGNITATITPTGQTFQMSWQQFHDYLVGPATSFDHILENGLEKNLSIASGGQGASGGPTGFAAGGAEPSPAVASASGGPAPTGPISATPPPPEQPPPTGYAESDEPKGYYEGGPVDDEEKQRRQQEEELARQAAQLAEVNRASEKALRPAEPAGSVRTKRDMGPSAEVQDLPPEETPSKQTVRDVLEHTRQAHGLSAVQTERAGTMPATGEKLQAQIDAIKSVLPKTDDPAAPDRRRTGTLAQVDDRPAAPTLRAPETGYYGTETPETGYYGTEAPEGVAATMDASGGGARGAEDKVRAAALQGVEGAEGGVGDRATAAALRGVDTAVARPSAVTADIPASATLAVGQADGRRVDTQGRPIGPQVGDAVAAAAAAGEVRRTNTSGQDIGGVDGISGAPTEVPRPQAPQQTRGQTRDLSTPVLGARRDAPASQPDPWVTGTGSRGGLGPNGLMPPSGYRYEYTDPRRLNGRGSSTGWNLVPVDPNNTPPGSGVVGGRDAYRGRDVPPLPNGAPNPLPGKVSPDSYKPENLLPGGAFRTKAMLPVESGYHMRPAEDPSLGNIAVPSTGAAPGTKDIVKYRADGTPVEMTVPSYWDPSKIRFQNPYAATGTRSVPVYDQPPQGATPTAPTGKGGYTAGLDTEVSQAVPGAPPWTPPTVGTGGRPPADAKGVEADAYRLWPNAGDESKRSAYIAQHNVEAQKGETKRTLAEEKAAGAMDMLQARLNSNERIAAGKSANYQFRTEVMANRDILRHMDEGARTIAIQYGKELQAGLRDAPSPEQQQVFNQALQIALNQGIQLPQLPQHGGAPAAAPAATPAASPASARQTQAPVKVTSPADARRYPRGTQIMLPDGSLGVVP